MTDEINRALTYDYDREKPKFGRRKGMPMLDTRGLLVLEYSPREKAWRIDDLEVVLKQNIGWFAKGEAGNDYRILAISESRDQLREYKKSLVKQKEAMG
ncbi:MAG TPA: hypothetical protein VK249_10990 [Anaerolineales bacterium]|nr:hypothetical protein [Anaerolineales bacterium]